MKRKIGAMEKIRTKYRGLLGFVSDGEIAKKANCTAEAVRLVRVELGVAPYTQKKKGDDLSLDDFIGAVVETAQEDYGISAKDVARLVSGRLTSFGGPDSPSS